MYRFAGAFNHGVVRRRLSAYNSFCTSAPVIGDVAPRRRFWIKEATVVVDSLCERSVTQAIKVLIDKSGEAAQQAPENGNIAQAEHGLVFIPQLNLLLPVQDGMLQVQHITTLPETPKVTANENLLKVVMCGFAARAQVNHGNLEDIERPVVVDRKDALDAALNTLGLGVNGDDLLGSEFVGTPPSRIYRSFICPRTPKDATKVLPESLERYALRVAEQIKFAVRHLRADRASYLRNIDKSTSEESPHSSSSGDSSTNESNNRAPESPNVKRHPLVLVLDNLRSAENVGSVFRSAETAGAAEIVTCGITPHPPHPKISKTAMQSVDSVPTRHFVDALEAIRALKRDGYTIAVMETTSLSKVYTSVAYPKKTAFVLGNEVTGVDTRIVEMADLVVEIPTYGVKNSLNVASAASVMLFEVVRQWHKDD